MNILSALAQACGRTYDIALTGGDKFITPYGQSDIWGYLNNGIGVIPYGVFGERLLTYGQFWDAIGTDYVSRSGKITRRIANYLYKTHSVKMTDDQVSELGNLCNRNLCATAGEYRVGFVARMADLWERGEYGDDCSCYWTHYKHCPPSIFGSGGAGITVRTRRHGGFGRAWIAPTYHENTVALWNWYGRSEGECWNISTLAHLLTTSEDSPFHGAQFANRDLRSPIMYINTTGAILFPPGIDKPTCDYSSRINATRIDPRTCCDCGEYLTDDESYRFWDQWYCENCFPGAQCSECNGEFHRNDLTHVDDQHNDLCPNCFEEHYRRCERCRAILPISEARELHNEWGNLLYYCAEHYPGVPCADCGADRHSHDMYLVAPETRICLSCRNDHYRECEDCFGLHRIESLRERNSVSPRFITGHRAICESCYFRQACSVCANGTADVTVDGADGITEVCRRCYDHTLTLIDISPQARQIAMILDSRHLSDSPA